MRLRARLMGRIEPDPGSNGAEAVNAEHLLHACVRSNLALAICLHGKSATCRGQKVAPLTDNF